jgi:hypothetical protein
MLIGGALVLAAMYLVELAPRRKIEAEVQQLTHQCPASNIGA